MTIDEAQIFTLLVSEIYFLWWCLNYIAEWAELAREGSESGASHFGESIESRFVSRDNNLITGWLFLSNRISSPFKAASTIHRRSKINGLINLTANETEPL
jgi:hypothetical protein